MHGKCGHKKDMKSKFKKYKDNAKTVHLQKREDWDVAGKIFDDMGGKPENLKGAFGSAIDSTGKKAKYGGIGEVSFSG